MNRKGHIKLHRKLLDWEWFKHPPTVVVWVTVLLMAEWRKDGKLKPGQVFTTRKELAELTGLTDRQIRTAIEHITTPTNKTTSPATIKTTNKGMLITIENWRFYQTNPRATDQRSDQPNDQPNDQPTLYKEEEEVKEGANGTELKEFVPMPEEFKAKLNAMFGGRKVN